MVKSPLETGGRVLQYDILVRRLAVEVDDDVRRRPRAPTEFVQIPVYSLP